MTIHIKDGIAYRVTTQLTPADQLKLIKSREAEALDRQQAQAQLTTEQVIQAGEDTIMDIFG